MKYQVSDQFPNLFYCDPDYYPVARGDEADLALQRFPELQANQEEFQAILDHNGLSGLTAFTGEQKLLIYRAHKKLGAILVEPSGDTYQFQLQIEVSKGQGFIIKGSIDRNGSITVQQRQPSFPTCPICLAAHTRIDTPVGPVAVEDLGVGDAVWTLDTTGERVAATILKTVRVFAAPDHQMVHIVFNDGRELWASPGHPTTDGRTMDDLRPGDLLGGGHITRLERVSYDQPATYDLLPSGGTGFYWANGILIGSTLADR
ncbi:MAG: Hint domain-containing protein [Dehalococcoidia bacterium]|nr:Hint domain-containing protein [Dehalococcoidia bacterium]